MRVLSVVVGLAAALLAGTEGKTVGDTVLTQDSSDTKDQSKGKTAAQATPTQRLASVYRSQVVWNAQYHRGKRSWLARAYRTYRAQRSRTVRSQVIARRNLRAAYGRAIMTHWRGGRTWSVIRTAQAYQRRLGAVRRSHAAVLRGQWSRYVARKNRYVRGQALRWRRRQAWYWGHRRLLTRLRNVQRAARRTAVSIRVVRSRAAAWRRRWSAAVRGRMAYYNRVLRSRLTSAVRRHVASRKHLRAAYGRVINRQWRAKQPNNVIRTARRFQAVLRSKNAAHARNLRNIRVGIAGAKRRYRAAQNRRLSSYNAGVRRTLNLRYRQLRSLRARGRGLNVALRNSSKRKVAF
jgi:hypothetical protein